MSYLGEPCISNNMSENPPLFCEGCSAEQLNELVQWINVFHPLLFLRWFLFPWFLKQTQIHIYMRHMMHTEKSL